jgi:hypothetical protein
MWTFTQNCFAEASILHWCRVFGSRNEPTHYSRFFDGKCFPVPDGSLLTLDGLRVRLYRAAKMSEENYLRFWNNLKKGRDKYFVHDEFTATNRGQFPDLDVLKSTSLEMRDVIHDVVSNEESEDPEMHKLFRERVQWHRNQEYLRDLENDAHSLKRVTMDGKEPEPSHGEATSDSAPSAESEASHA